MSEVNLPSLYKYDVSSEVESCFDKNEVYFVLNYGVLSVVCWMKAECITEQFEVNSTDNDPQNSFDRDFKYLKVGETEVNIDCSDIDLVSGQQIELTENQIQKLNEYLKDNMILV